MLFTACCAKSFILFTEVIMNLLLQIIWLCLSSLSCYTTGCETKQKTIWLNVFVHGTTGIEFVLKSPFNLLALRNQFFEETDNTDNLDCINTIMQAREKPVIYTTQPLGPLGLYEVTPSFNLPANSSLPLYSSIPLTKIYQMLSGDKNGDESKCYTFGWSGILSQQYRQKESVIFFDQLSKEVEKYKEKGFDVKIRILAHSHGGNVALGLAGIYNVIQMYDKPLGKDLEYLNLLGDKRRLRFFSKIFFTHQWSGCQTLKQVDELVMLGTPIQKETSFLASSPFFGKVYNIYSKSDAIQTRDFFSSKESFFSKRTLEPIYNFENIHQVEIKIARQSFFGKEIFCGPSHQEMWFVVPESNTKYNFLCPIPLVCYFSQIKLLVNNTSGYSKVIIRQNEFGQEFSLLGEPKKQVVIETKKVNDIKEAFVPWLCKIKEISQEPPRDFLEKAICFVSKLNL